MNAALSLRVVGAAFSSGALFAVGLLLAGMTNPAKVLGFLDFFGNWDASLMLVMLGAIGVNAPLTRAIRRRNAPLLQPSFSIPPSNRPWRSQLDVRLLVGAGLFGVGWGLGGYCPGPALVALPEVFTEKRGTDAAWFTAAMLVGMAAFSVYDRHRQQKVSPIGQQCCEPGSGRGSLPVVDGVSPFVVR